MGLETTSTTFGGSAWYSAFVAPNKKYLPFEQPPFYQPFISYQTHTTVMTCLWIWALSLLVSIGRRPSYTERKKTCAFNLWSTISDNGQTNKHSQQSIHPSSWRHWLMECSSILHILRSYNIIHPQYQPWYQPWYCWGMHTSGGFPKMLVPQIIDLS